MRLPCLVLILWAVTLSAGGQPPPVSFSTDPAIHALCGERVVLLGESPTHSFGNTLLFKAQLVRRLVDECHFSALFMESGVYDYVHLDHERRSGQDVSDAIIAAAIGGLWANREVQSLIPFLRQKVNEGSLSLGGLDDQIGRGSYASLGMANDLVQQLPATEKARCQAVLERHLRWRYTEDAPYRVVDKEKVLTCLKEVRMALPSMQGQPEFVEESRVMVASLERNLARNFTEDDFTHNDQALKWFNDRDLSMYLNFEWFRARLPADSKIIVWAASVHTAKSLSGIPSMEGRVPLGWHIQQELEDRVFSLAFSAAAGTYGSRHQPTKELATAPPSSVEAQAIAHTHDASAYLSRRQLRRFGAVPGRLLGTDFKTAHWDQVVDGLEVVRKENPPDWIEPAP